MIIFSLMDPRLEYKVTPFLSHSDSDHISKTDHCFNVLKYRPDLHFLTQPIHLNISDLTFTLPGRLLHPLTSLIPVLC